MKGKELIIKEIAFCNSSTSIAGSWHVGNRANNPACRYSKRTDSKNYVTFNHAAIAMENLNSGKSRCALYNMDDGSQIVYLVYESKTYGTLRAYITPEDPMRITMDHELKDDSYMKAFTAQAVSAYYLVSDPDTSPYKGCIVGIKDLQAEAKRIQDNRLGGPDDMARISDIFFYGIVKPADQKCTVEYSKTFSEQFAQLSRNATVKKCSLSKELKDLPSARKARKNTSSKSNPLMECSLDEFAKNVIEGEYTIPYTWSEDQRRLIPDRNQIWSTYVCSEQFRRVIIRVYMSLVSKVMMLRKGSSIEEIMNAKATVENILLVGPPDSGKTYAVTAMCAALGIPVGLHTCQSNMEESSIEGEPKVVNGSVVTLPSKVIELFSVGGCINLEEINLSDPGVVQGVLGQGLEYPYVLKYNGYYEMKRHPLTIMVATMNPDMEGTRPLNEALASRFSHVLFVQKPEKEEMINRLVSDGFRKSDCTKVYGIYEKITKLLERVEPSLLPRISGRACRECLTSVRYGYSWADAVEETLIGQIYAASPEVGYDVHDALRPFLT